MKSNIGVLLLALVSIARNVTAQNGASAENMCFHPLSFKFAEFNPADLVETNKVLKEFETRLRTESREASGVIFVYGGKSTRFDEITDAVAVVKKRLNLPEKYSDNQNIWVSNGGYRSILGAEIFIRPLNCSDYPRPKADFEADQVEFTEAPPESTIKKSPSELLRDLKSKTEIVCPAAATAVGACKGEVQVFVIINETGNVVFSSAISGHPLLKAAGVQGVKAWKFIPARIAEKHYKSSGIFTVTFKERQVTIDY